MTFEGVKFDDAIEKVFENLDQIRRKVKDYSLWKMIIKSGKL